MNRSALLWLLALIAWIILGVFLCNKYLCGHTPATSVTNTTLGAVKDKVKDIALGTWSLSDGSNFKVDSKDHFQFLRSKFTHLAPLSAGLNGLINKTADYLKANPDRGVTITGYYKDDEQNNSILKNLGLARANDIKKILIDMGVSGGQLATKSDPLRFNWFRSDTLAKGVDFSFGNIEKGDERLADIKKRLVGKPITLYFKTNQSRISLTGQQRQDFADVIYYLDNVSGSNLDVWGHTDNEGGRRGNLTLSRKRADFISSYLTKNGGISSQRMTNKGYGPDKPISSNGNETGKAKNRRVEVILR